MGRINIKGNKDIYFDNNSLLMFFDGDFKDYSNNDFSVTVYGNTRISTVQSKFGGSSAYFDGNGDYLEVASNNVFDFGTGDFTIEAWIYLDSIPLDYFITSGNSSGALFFGFRFTGGSNQIGWGRAGVTWDYSTPSGIVTGQWYHVAISRNGTAMRLFVNGNQVGITQTNSTAYNLGLGNLAIGAQANNYFLNGYIDDLRVKKGIALYTSNFIPPGKLLTIGKINSRLDLSNTSILLDMEGDNNSIIFKDSSSNNFTVTRNGSPIISTEQAKYGRSSGYFPGTNNYIRFSQTACEFRREDFTIEMWLYQPSSAPPVSVRLFQANLINSFGFEIGGGWVFKFGNNSGVILETDGIPYNTWTHLAISRNSGTLRVFLNGVLKGSVVDTSDYGGLNGNSANLGDASGAYGWVGYIDNFRIIKGVGKYTSNFQPSASTKITTDNLRSNLRAFWKLSDITDSSGNGNTFTNNGNVQFVAGKIGNCALWNSPKTDTKWLERSHSSLSFGTGNFTVSFWVYPFFFPSDALPDPFKNICSLSNGFGTFSPRIAPMIDRGGGRPGNLRFIVNTSTTNEIDQPITFYNWHHVVFSRNNGVISVYLNNIYLNQFNFTTSLGGDFLLGVFNDRRADGFYQFEGRIDAVGVWARTLTQAEINLLYNNRNGLEL